VLSSFVQDDEKRAHLSKSIELSLDLLHSGQDQHQDSISVDATFNLGQACFALGENEEQDGQMEEAGRWLETAYKWFSEVVQLQEQKMQQFLSSGHGVEHNASATAVQQDEAGVECREEEAEETITVTPHVLFDSYLCLAEVLVMRGGLNLSREDAFFFKVASDVLSKAEMLDVCVESRGQLFLGWASLLSSQAECAFNERGRLDHAQYRKALEFAQRAIELVPSSTQALCDYGDIASDYAAHCAETADAEEAWKLYRAANDMYQSATKKTAGQPRMYLRLGMVNLALSSLHTPKAVANRSILQDNAAAYFRQALKLDPASTESLFGRLYVEWLRSSGTIDKTLLQKCEDPEELLQNVDLRSFGMDPDSPFLIQLQVAFFS
jgi:tetratricopeptide (TPR) repeat protein